MKQFLERLVGARTGLAFCALGLATMGGMCPNMMQPPTGEEANWVRAFDASQVGALSAVWGSSADSVFAVGGIPGQGEVYHYDGENWQAMLVPDVPLLVWVFGFGPDNVYAVGEEGGIIHFDGVRWRRLNLGATEDLWGIWGTSPDDMWIVGGDLDQGSPALYQFDGATLTAIDLPANDRSPTALFKVWGIGSKVIAVGSNGLIIEYDGTSWSQMPSGAAADDDFVSLWGTSPDNIVAVGGRSVGQIAHYDGNSWTTQKQSGVPGLNAVYMTDAAEAIIGGVNGLVGSYNPMTSTLMTENASTTLTIHGIWGDGMDRFYGVGGRFSDPYSGLALVRTFEAVVDNPDPPADAPPLATNLELGIANGAPYRVLNPGDEMPVFAGGQGGFHIFLSMQLTGFPAGETVQITRSARLSEDDTSVIDPLTFNILFSEIEPGVNELRDLFIQLTTNRSNVVDRLGVISIELTSTTDPTLTASAEIEVLFVANQ